MPGVHLILTYADLPEPAQKPLTLLVPNPAITQLFMPMVLANDEACYVGEPLAVVLHARQQGVDGAGDARFRVERGVQIADRQKRRGHRIVSGARTCRAALRQGRSASSL